MRTRLLTKMRSHTLVAVTGLALLLAACAADDDPVAENDVPVDEEEELEDVRLNLASFTGGEHVLHEPMWEYLRDEISDRTDGRVEIEIHPGGALTAGPETYENVQAGAIEMGWALQGYTPGRFPLTEVIEFPFLFDSAEEATNVLWDLYEEFPELQEEYGDVKILGLWVHDIGELFTVDNSVEQLEDVQGLRLRNPGPIQERLIDALGASAVSMPSPDIFDSLERGVIDGAMLAQSAVLSFGLLDLVDHVTKCGCYVASGFVGMNLDTWESLDDEAQQAFEEVTGRDLSLRAAVAYDEEYDIVDGHLEEEGVEFIELSDDELARWEDQAEPIIEEWIEEREADGFPARELWDRMMELAEQQ